MGVGAVVDAAVPAGPAPAEEGQDAATPALPAPPSDRLVRYLITFATTPFAFMLIQRAAESQQQRGAAAVLDPKRRMSDFAEGSALASFERWCHRHVYASALSEALHKYGLMIRAVALHHAQSEFVRARVLDSWVLRRLAVPPDSTVEQLVQGHLARAGPGRKATTSGGASRAAAGTGGGAGGKPPEPEVAIAALQAAVAPNVQYLKSVLERRYTLHRGRTVLESMELVLGLFRMWAHMYFRGLRLVARACNYSSSLLGILSGALSFTVVLSIALSVLSAGWAIAGLVLSTVADFAEPVTMSALRWTESGAAQAHEVSGRIGFGGIGPRTLPPLTVEEAEGFLDGQLRQASSIVNRPEVPRLASVPLLVKAYDLGIINANGDVEEAAVDALIAKGGLGPFRRDGFFAYAARRQIKAAVILLARALAWRRINAVVVGDEALRFVLILGQRQAGKATLFSRLTSYSQDYGRLVGGAHAQMPAVDMRALSGQRATHAVVFPGLKSSDTDTARLSSNLARALTGLCAAVVFVAHPTQGPTAEDLRLLAPALAAGKSVLVAVNGPDRARAEGALSGGSGRTSAPATATATATAANVGNGDAAPAGSAAAAGPDGGAARAGGSRHGARGGGASDGGGSRGPVAGREEALESVRSAWQSALEVKCLELGADTARIAVMITEVEADEKAVPPGVHRYSQVQDWVARAAHEYQRTV